MGKISNIIKGAIELEQAFKEAEAAKKFPINLTRALPKTQEKITELADRVARQQMGEHVKSGKPKDTKNLAGRSMKESKRLQGLDYTLEPTRELRPTPVYEGKVGDVNIALPGDQTVSDRVLLDVNGLPIESPQQGGSLYGEGKLDLEDPLFWASGREIAKQFQNKVTKLADLYNADDVMAHHLAMGPVSNNFAMHFADANLRAIANSDISPEAAEAFNAVIRAGYKDNKGKHIPLPHFVGIENPNEAYLQMMEDSGLRKWFNNRMKVPSITQPLGLPNGQDIQWAITEPKLRNMEPNLTGHSVGKMKPGAELTDTANHNTYEAGIQGESMGRAPELAPFDLSFPDASMYVRNLYSPSDFTGTIQKVFPHQVVDQQHLDEMSKYYEELRRIRGFADGGDVSAEGGEVDMNDGGGMAKGGKVDLEQEFIKADSFAKGGWNSPNASKDPKYNGPEYELAKMSTIKNMGKILAKHGAQQLKKEFANPNGQMAVDVLGNLGADILGSPSDMLDIARGTPMKSYKPYKGVDLERERKGIPMLGSENIKKQLKDTGITSGTERPLTENALAFATPAVASKAPKIMKGIEKIADMNLPVGLSIKDVSDAKKAVEFRSSLAKAVNNHKMETMPGPQWSAWLNANASKSAKKEAEATGLYDWLKTQPKVTKYDIEEHIGENLPKVIAKDKGKPLQLTEAERDELSDLRKRHSSVMHGNKETPLTKEEMEKLMHYSDISEMATPQNLRWQAERMERSAQKMKDEGYSYTAFVEAREAEHLRNRADYLQANPKVYGGAKFEKEYTSPGGSNYRETMLSLPRQHKPEYTYNVHGYSPKEGFATKAEAQAYADEQNNLPSELREKLKTIDPSAQEAMERVIGKMENYPHSVLEIESPISRKNNPDFNVPHAHTYDDPETDYNRIAHLRMKDRPTKDNKRGLFLEELQSDWAQLGRDEGFRQAYPKLTDVEERRFQELLEDGRRNLEGDKLAEFESLIAKRDAYASNPRIPSGPYVTDTKDWTALGLKHALKKAVEGGHDYMAWTTGAQQADRYDLSKQVNRVQLYEHPDSDYRRLVVNDLEGNEVVNENILPKQLPDFVGKEVADKLLTQEPMQYYRKAGTNEPSYLRELKNMDLRIGGEGMKTYYDQLVPSTMNDILKQVGATERVKPIDFHFEKGLHSNVEHPEYGEPVYSTHLGIEITPELRELVLNEGLPHFHEGGEVDARTVKRGNIKPIDLKTEFKLSKFKE
jgi:hypothetical protein